MGSMHPHPIEREYEEKFIWGPPIYHPHARLVGGLPWRCREYALYGEPFYFPAKHRPSARAKSTLAASHSDQQAVYCGKQKARQSGRSDCKGGVVGGGVDVWRHLVSLPVSRRARR